MRSNFSDIELGKLPEAFVERTAPIPMQFDKTKFLDGFPEQQWRDQTNVYAAIWPWYSGDVLAETKPGQDNEPQTQYPLHLNPIRGICKKHAAVLFGEVPDGPEPLVEVVVGARKPFDGTDPKEADKKLAKMCERIINEVIQASYGRARQLENGILSQFLGGHAFQLSYQPKRVDLLIPIVLQNPRPDYFLPVWENEDLYTLTECWTAYQIPQIVAKRQYGISAGTPGQKVTFMEKWTEAEHIVTVDGKLINEGNTENIFMKVPSVYTPHMRVGGRMGIGHVQDIAAAVKEYNANFAALGEAVLQTPDRNVYLSNSYQAPTVEYLPDGRKMTMLGYTPAASGSKDAPKVSFEEQPQVSEAMIRYLDMIWRQILRDSDMSSIPFGEDEGSQRSGQTLALRMFPTLSHIGHERTNWNDGLTKVGKDILMMVKTLQGIKGSNTAKLLDDLGINLPDDYLRRIEISTKWAPKIPQDRKQLVDELAVLGPIGFVSTEQAVTMLNNSPDVQLELQRIEKDQKTKAELAASQKPPPFGGSGAAPSKPTGTVTPSKNGVTAT